MLYLHGSPWSCAMWSPASELLKAYALNHVFLLSSVSVSQFLKFFDR